MVRVAARSVMDLIGEAAPLDGGRDGWLRFEDTDGIATLLMRHIWIHFYDT